MSIPPAGATGCPDVEVIFARGTLEPPGVGSTGEAFVDALRAQTKGKSVEVYPVEYPASLAFSTAADGVVDASNRVKDVAVRCPNTKMVIGGFSQGAAVAAYTTMDGVPSGFELPEGITGPLPAQVADHVAAVALLGKPSDAFLRRVDTTAPPITIGHRYAAKTLDMCVSDDPICSPEGSDNTAHGSYREDQMSYQAAEFVAQKINSSRGAHR